MKNMNKYDKMIEKNKKSSEDKINRAKQAIQEMLDDEEKVTIPRLMKSTGLSRGFFYKNPTVRKAIDWAMEQQAGMVDRRRAVLDMAMDNRIMLLEEEIVRLQRENAELKKQNERLHKILNKKELNILKNF